MDILVIDYGDEIIKAAKAFLTTKGLQNDTSSLEKLVAAEGEYFAAPQVEVVIKRYNRHLTRRDMPSAVQGAVKLACKRW